MPTYKAELLFKYSGNDAEDDIEEWLRDFMKQNEMFSQGGPIVFKMYT